MLRFGKLTKQIIAWKSMVTMWEEKIWVIKEDIKWLFDNPVSLTKISLVWQTSSSGSQILQPLAGHAWAHIKKQCCWTFSDQAQARQVVMELDQKFRVVGTTQLICKQNILQILFFRTTQPFNIFKIVFHFNYFLGVGTRILKIQCNQTKL